MTLYSFSENQIIERLRFDNPWWTQGKIEDYYNLMRRRLYFNLFISLVKERGVKRAIVLMGPRRVGKTVMLFHAIQELLNEDVDPRKIAYISVETPIYNKIGLEQLFGIVRKASGIPDPEKWIVFFDEVQYLKDWEVHLKSLVDSYPFTKFIASGSAAAALKLKSTESGAGRFTDFMLPALTFSEYIYLKGLEKLVLPSFLSWEGNIQSYFTTLAIKDVNNHFLDYINFGGYPEVIFSDKIKSDPGRYIRSDIVDKVLLRDLPSIYGIQDVQELNSLFTAIAYNSGCEFTLEDLSKTSGIEKVTIKRYIKYLEAAFLIKIIHRTANKPKEFKRANFFKIYLTNPSLRSALFAPLHPNDDYLGHMVETAIYAQWLHREWFSPYYARWANGEVDMIGLDDRKLKPVWAIEIKWSNNFFEKPGDLKSLLKYCRENNLKSALVTTIDKEGTKEIQDITLHFIPAALYAYTIGINTILKKQKYT